MSKLYFAGPLFTWGEREQNKQVAEELRRRGHEVFVPQEQEQKAATARAIFRADISGIAWSEIVVACMDGADPDSGTCFEAGYVYQVKPLILYRTDIREEKEPLGPYNLMLHEAADAVLNLQWLEPRAIGETIDGAIRRLGLDATS
jgi:nucleoside 2-deoxyribosyltransferase